MVKLYPPLIKGLDIRSLHFAAKSPDMTISYSPFGRVAWGGVVYTKAPPKLKGKKKIPQPTALREFNPKGAGWDGGVTVIYHPTKGYILLPVSAASLFKMKKRPFSKAKGRRPAPAAPAPVTAPPAPPALPPY